MNFSELAIIKRVEEKYESLEGIEQGGITYINIDLDDMFNMVDAVITSLQKFFKNFARDGVAKYPSENVALLVNQINDVVYGVDRGTGTSKGYTAAPGSPSAVYMSFLVHLN